MWSQSSQTPALEAINKHLLVQLRTASSCFPAKSCSHHVPVHSVISSLHHRPRRIWCDLTFMLKTVLWLRLQKYTAAWESESEGDTKQSPQAFALLIHPPGHTVNMEVYCNEPRSLRENIWHKPPTLWHRAPLSAFGCSLIHDAQREAPRVWFGTFTPDALPDVTPQGFVSLPGDALVFRRMCKPPQSHFTEMLLNIWSIRPHPKRKAAAMEEVAKLTS